MLSDKSTLLRALLTWPLIILSDFENPQFKSTCFTEVLREIQLCCAFPLNTYTSKCLSQRGVHDM